MLNIAPWFGLHGRQLTGLIGLVSGLCFFLFGYDQADFGGLLTVPAFRERFPQIDTIANPDSRSVALALGATTASWNAGCIVSAISTIWVGSLLGRKRTIFVGLAILIIGEIIQTSSYSLGQLVAGRVIAGIGNGFTTASIPAYQAETSRAHRRGTYLMISSCFIAAGAAFSYWIDFAFSYISASSASWRVPVAFQLVVAIPLFTVVLFLPESPRWLILYGRADEAMNVLSALNNVDINDTRIYKEFLAIKDSMIEISSGSFSDIFTQGEKRHLHRTLLACVIQSFQQITGINFLMQYLAFMFLTQFGYEAWLARLMAACVGVVSLFASIVPAVGIDNYWGRRSLFLFGTSIMCASMIVLTGMSWLGGQTGQVVGTLFIFFFGIAFVIGWQGMSWLYSVEIVPLRIRGPATALSTAFNWIMNFWVVLIAPIALHDIGWRTYIIFAVMNAFIFPCVYLFFPECAYRTLEEMDVIFHAASLSRTPWTTVVRDSREAPLWYGRDGQKAFDYEDSAWHKRNVRFSDEVSSSTEKTQKFSSQSGGFDDSSSSEGDEDLTTGDTVSHANELPAGATTEARKKMMSRDSGRV